MEDQRQKTEAKRERGAALRAVKRTCSLDSVRSFPRPDDCHLGPPRSSCGCGGPSPLPRATRYAPRSACTRFLTCQPAASLQPPPP